MPEFNARIKLKSDTQAKWEKVPTFLPLAGELIIYSPDNDHPYCRLKIGDGSTLLKDLPFIDAGTLNGKETEIVKLNTFNDRPQPGSPDKLYVDLSTNYIYHYDANSGYTRLLNFTFTVTKIPVSKISSWTAGSATTATLQNNILQINNGSAPQLYYYNTEAIDSIIQG